MSANLGESLAAPYRMGWTSALGAFAVIIALASCGGDSTQESTSTAVSTTTAPSTTTVPTSTATTSSSTTTVLSDPAEAVVDFDVSVDVDTEWGEVFDALTTTEQECLRETFDGDLLESVLDRSVMSGWETPEAGEILMYSCLAPQTARSVFLSTIVVAMGEDTAFEVDADGEACLAEWVAGLDVVFTMATLSVDHADAASAVTSAFMICNPDLVVSNPDLFVSLMLEETGLTLEDLSEDEASCLQPWVANTDWTSFLTGATDGHSMLRDFIPNLLDCAPNLVVSLMLEETGLALEDLSEEEASCLQARVANTDWTNVYTRATGDPSLLFEVFAGLFDCVPDLSWSESGDQWPESSDRPWDELTQEATPAEIGVATQGELEHVGDSDFFAFEATEGELYDLDVTIGTLRDSRLTIHDSNGYGRASDDDNGDSTGSRLIWRAPSTDTFYVEVASPDDGTGTYTLTIATSDIDDDHPSSTTHATPVELDVATQGELEYYNDNDVFAFEATRGQAYELHVTLQDSRLFVFDADGKSMISYVDSTASPHIWHAPDTGTYYVAVAGIATGTYTLTIGISDIDDDHPNSADNATPIEIGVATQGELENEDDFDFFTFEATKGQLYELDVTLGTLQGSIFALYNADGTLIREIGRDDPSRLIWTAPSTGNYYVRVNSTGTGTYTLTIGISDIDDDHANLPDSATPIEIGVATQGELEYEDDFDFFAFEAIGGELYELDVTLGTLQDSTLQIYDTNLNWVPGQAGNDNVIWFARSTGSYYVFLTGFDTGTYTLTIAISDIDDHANSADKATPIAIGVATQGELEYEGDIDFFTFEATGGEVYDLHVTTKDSELDLFDADGTWLDGTDVTSSRLVWFALGTGNYYVQVSRGTGTYTLTIARS